MRNRGRGVFAGIVLAGLPVLAGRTEAQLGHVVQSRKISQTTGGFGGVLDPLDQFGRSIVHLGDLNGDGVGDLLVGSHTDDDGPDNGVDRGSVWVLFLTSSGHVAAETKISEGHGGFSGWLDPGDQFGRAAARIGDLDGDGLPEVAVSANYDDDGGTNKGALYVLFLNADGTVRQVQKISETSGNLGFELDIHDEFGRSITALGDLDGDGVPDLLVGAPLDDEGGTQIGGAYVLFLNTDGTVKESRKLDRTTAGLRLKPGDWFGFSGTTLGDLDGDGALDVAIGAILDDDGGMNRGAVWILGLEPNGDVRTQTEINSLTSDLPLDDFDLFGTSVAALGDLDGDGVCDLAVGAVKDDDGGAGTEANVGAVYVLFLNSDATLKGWTKISELAGDFTELLDEDDWFGSALASVGGAPGDGLFNLAIGGRYDDDGAGNAGSIYLVQLNDGSAPVVDFSASRTYGVAPLTVAFTDLTQGDVTGWVWSFSDGPVSTEQHPVHEFTQPGSYEITLSARGPTGADVETRTGYVVVIDGVLAAFDATPRSGPAPLTVDFMDLSEGQVTSWSWSFGDGATATGPAPTHGYATEGLYDVTLAIAGPTGTHEVTLPDFVEVLPPAPLAAFAVTPAQGAVPLSVAFADQSTGAATSWAWDFGDGTTSSAQSPTHLYEAPGSYTVTLVASGPGGSGATTIVDCVLAAVLAPVASFDATPLTGPAPLLVAFADQSAGANAWSWDFGDGTISTERNPEHVYAATGTYDVTLTVSGPGGTDVLVRSALIDADLPLPEADFNVTGRTGTGIVTTQFTDASSEDVTTWSWDFGDGTTSTEQNPQHVYSQPGTYTVTLTVTGPGGTTTVTQEDVIVVSWPAPVADFDLGTAAGLAPLTVGFTDESTGNVTAWAWNFGDGGGSSEQSPVHVYTTPGTYTVTLTASGPGGSDDHVRVDAVVVGTPAPTAAFQVGPPIGFAPLPVSFSDVSIGEVTSRLWDFGDGTTSTQSFPVKTYMAPGVYTVTLAVSGPGGSGSVSQQAVEVLRLSALRDGGFDRQDAGLEPTNGWSSLGTPALVHPLTITSDGLMPSDGTQWCEVTAAGSVAATPASNPGGPGAAPAGASGLEQRFRYSAAAPHLAFEAAFVCGEPPQSLATDDFMSVDVWDGTTWWNVFQADTFSDLPLTSSVHGLPMTPVSTVAVDLRTLFPEAPEGQVMTLRVSVGNGGDGQNPSYGYVDGFRFTPVAVATPRNGVGVNASRYVSGPAVLGGDWHVSVDTAGHASARRVRLVGTLRPASGLFRTPGEVLVSGDKIVDEAWPVLGDVVEQVIALPLDLTLVGSTLNTQVIITGGATEYTNAYDLLLGF
jgi:PKD repeat protein